jgi:hypothetical protein
MIVPLVPMAGMSGCLGMMREAEIEPGEVERRRDGQQQDQAKAEPLPQRSSSELPNAVHAHSLRKAARLRHPYIAAP